METNNLKLNKKSCNHHVGRLLFRLAAFGNRCHAYLFSDFCLSRLTDSIDEGVSVGATRVLGKSLLDRSLWRQSLDVYQKGAKHLENFEGDNDKLQCYANCILYAGYSALYSEEYDLAKQYLDTLNSLKKLEPWVTWRVFDFEKAYLNFQVGMDRVEQD